MSDMPLRTITAVLAALVLVSTGCARVESALAPEPSVVTVEATVAAPGARLSGETPSGAAGVPLWPGAAVTESDASEGSIAISLVTSDPFGDVVAGLATGFKQAGWQVAEDATSESGARDAVLTVTGPDAEGLIIVTDDGEGTVRVDYAITAITATKP